MAALPAASATSETGLATRPIRFEDVDEILRLVERAVEHGCRDHYDASQRKAVYLGYARNLFVEALGPFDTIVVEQHGRTVGVAQLDPFEDRLRALFVDAHYQQKGIGKLLLTQIEERARWHRATYLHGAMALNAVPFYLRSGFQPCGSPERLVSAGVWVPILRMEKNLRSPGEPPRDDRDRDRDGGSWHRRLL